MTACIRRPHSYWTTCPCADCEIDRRRKHKLYSGGRAYRVPNDRAWDILVDRIAANWTDKAIASACGLKDGYFSTLLAKYRRDQTRVHLGPFVAQAILNMGTPTRGSISAEPSRRRLRALTCMGYSLERLADETGLGFSTLAAIRNNTVRVTAARALVITEAYDRLHMTFGPDAQAAARAKAKGWAPPLAWEDIERDDDASAHLYRPATSAELAADSRDRFDALVNQGAGLSGVMHEMGRTREALWMWCKREGRLAQYRVLVERSGDRGTSITWGEAS